MSGVASHVLLAQQPALVNRRRRGWVSGPGYFRTASISGTLLPSREPLPRKGVPPASPTDVTRRVAAYYPICSAMQYLALDRETCKEHPAVCTARPLDSSTEARATASRLSRSTEKARAVTGTVRHEQSPLSGPSDLASLVRPLAPRRRQRAPIPRMRRMYRQKSVHISASIEDAAAAAGIRSCDPQVSIRNHRSGAEDTFVRTGEIRSQVATFPRMQYVLRLGGVGHESASIRELSFPRQPRCCRQPFHRSPTSGHPSFHLPRRTVRARGTGYSFPQPPPSARVGPSTPQRLRPRQKALGESKASLQARTGGGVQPRKRIEADLKLRQPSKA
ncbi:hypothetical protein HPB51_018319 [Rhipicephalus microplus]|uniref:Uncharacterized protein n=1 Tax=Rhipicephalus microplus TaxID=6941 RepID=A0A9J6DB73_RHIMP|nr:hypothetical protein HPB51_018319 [Rhipicephalus microplus]